MKVYNKSNKEQKVRITDRYRNTYTVYLQPNRTVTLEPDQVSADVRNLLSAGVLEEVVDGTPIKRTVMTPEVPVANKHIEKECACCNVPELTDNSVESSVVDESETESVDSVENDVVVDTSVEDVNKDKSSENPSVYKCEICGSEYASARGLNMHVSRAHPETTSEEV